MSHIWRAHFAFIKSGKEDLCLFTKFHCSVSVLNLFAMAAGKKPVMPNTITLPHSYAFLILIAVKHKQYWYPQPSKCSIFRLIHLWPGTAAAASFWGFPMCFSAFENPAVIINTCVNRYLLAQRWLGVGLATHHLQEKVTKALPQ